MSKRITSPKIREAESMAGWFTLVTWIGCIIIFVLVANGQWTEALYAFPFTTLAVIVAIKSGQEVNTRRLNAQTLKEEREEDVKALYGER